MTIDELRAQRKALLQRKQQLIDSGADPIEIQKLREELISVNSALRRLTPSHRIGGKKRSGGDLAGTDRKQYQDWTTSWGELEDDGLTWREIEDGSSVLREIVSEADKYLTDAEKRYFDLWSGGVRMVKIARECGVNISTVSRSLAAAKKKLNDAADRRRIAEQGYTGSGIRLDISEAETAKALISKCTAVQTVYLYLYYGEWLSCSEIGRLLGVDKSAVLRGITRGLCNIGKLFPGKEIFLDNMEALGDLAYSLYIERKWSDEELGLEETPGLDWGRRKLGLPTRQGSPAKRDLPPILMTTPDGNLLDVRLPRFQKIKTVAGKLLNALLEQWRLRIAADGERSAMLRRWLKLLFQKLKRRMKGDDAQSKKKP